ncbi:DNA-binding response OmpR family regulator [Virgibacillus natechei]|uniref:DNA-binding response OmpR family regulator n=1 Tax=Virgibacillus natechei TaxID=1216297 RepID=A0ABS4IC05_9BACI|nr:response regulator transcription factor [Virgibacillus natechei]MBP1968476.1 DNA-binding response OmpR family regulator [Virgibacillus natechei]UZD13594.1 response regulator transcription factor [Virgibacillus natechei]
MNKVLLVDDEQRMLDLLGLYLKPYNYTYKKALGSKEALSYMEQESFQLVLLDIMMPDLDGWELCRKIRRISDVPIIMITGRDQPGDIIKGLRLGADDYMIKPFHKDELLARMEALLRRRNPRNPNQVFAREQLIDLVWGYTSVTDERTVDSHVRNMRGKIRDAGFPIDKHLKTVWGVGYKWMNA